MRASSQQHSTPRAHESYPTATTASAGYDDSVWEYAPRRARFLAFLIDQLLIISCVLTLVAIAALEVFLTSDYGEVDPPESASVAAIVIVAAGAPLWALYYTLTWARGGRTLGQLIMGLRVVRRDGAPLGYWRAAARMLAFALSSLTLHLLALPALLTEEHRTTHDVIAGTVVVRDDPHPWPAYEAAG